MPMMVINLTLFCLQILVNDNDGYGAINTPGRLTEIPMTKKSTLPPIGKPNSDR